MSPLASLSAALEACFGQWSPAQLRDAVADRAQLYAAVDAALDNAVANKSAAEQQQRSPAEALDEDVERVTSEMAEKHITMDGQPFDAEFDTPEESDEEASAAPSRMIIATLNHTARGVSSGRSSCETVLLLRTAVLPGSLVAPQHRRTRRLHPSLPPHASLVAPPPSIVAANARRRSPSLLPASSS